MKNEKSSIRTTNRSELQEISRLIKAVASEHEIAARIERLSAAFVGRPYAVNPLGEADSPEQLVIKFDGFDCVTYMETILALALSRKTEDFARNLQRIRYHSGDVSWHSRNHYMVDWWTNNEKTGLLKNVTTGAVSEEKRRRLNVVKGLPEKNVVFRVFPKHKIAQLQKRIESGDFICFASTKKNLDVFHTGILIRQGNEILLRHAIRSQGAVVEQPLCDFLKNNRMSGLILLHPLDPYPSYSA